MTIKNQKFKKKKHLRNNEYYNLQNENLNEEQMQKLNELRELVGNCKLV